MNNLKNLLQEYAVPLFGGIILSIWLANVEPEIYQTLITTKLLPFQLFGHEVTLQFVFNDIFIALLFGVATIELIEAMSKGGALDSLSKAMAPIFGTIGGVVFPALLFIAFLYLFVGGRHIIGWPIPTATDIGVAWRAAIIIFGRKHPAVLFLVALSLFDDGIGLAIIAFVFPHEHGIHLSGLLLVLLAMLLAWAIRTFDTERKSFWPYLLLPGILSYIGFLYSGIHPSLALVPIIPFIPKKSINTDPYVIDHNTPLGKFEKTFVPIVDFGLFGFAFVNLGIPLVSESFSVLAFIIFGSLVIGKTAGIYFCAKRFVVGISSKELFIAAYIGSIGLTVSTFMSIMAYADPDICNQAKMGALMSLSAVIVAPLLGKILKIRKIHE